MSLRRMSISLKTLNGIINLFHATQDEEAMK